MPPHIRDANKIFYLSLIFFKAQGSANRGKFCLDKGLRGTKT